jgi:hypothetical protein
MGLAVAHLAPKSYPTSAANGRAKTPRSLLFSAFIVFLALLVMPCMNTTTAATRFLSPVHATLFLALHRPAFALFVVVVLVQHQSGDWQQQLMAKRCFFFDIVCEYLIIPVCLLQFSGLHFAQSPKGYQTHHTRL